jgi:hypothetical protein
LVKVKKKSLKFARAVTMEDASGSGCAQRKGANAS